MRTIAVINQKGGVGKTTTAVNLAAALVRAGQRVLLIDLDPQSHATLHVGIELGSEDRTIYDVLVRGAAIAETARLVDDRLTVVPAHLDLVAAEIELADQPERETVLARALQAYHEHYDLMIIDCAPSLGLLSVNALAAVDEVFIPLQPHFLALQGLSKLLETVTMVRDALRPALRVSGVVFCMSESATRLAQEIYGDVEQFVRSAEPETAWAGAIVFNTRIRRNIKLAECPSFGKTIFEYAAGSHGAEDYRTLAAEVLAMAQPTTARSMPESAVLPRNPSAAASAAV
ncbi:MAG: ParA family protein [Planctomycetes bacterium]|nr:ParA family protein [Planctomycetota bacterium]